MGNSELTEHSKKTCPSCGAVLEDWAHICPNCEYEWLEPIPDIADVPLSLSRFILFVLASLVGIALIFVGLPSSMGLFFLYFSNLALSYEQQPQPIKGFKDFFSKRKTTILIFSLILIAVILVSILPLVNTNIYFRWVIRIFIVSFWTLQTIQAFKRYRLPSIASQPNQSFNPDATSGSHFHHRNAPHR